MNEETKTRLRCRPGDLAIVTNCAVPERLGLVVRVIERCSEAGYEWLTEVRGWGVWGRDVKSGRVARCRFALMRDASLTPIKGETHRPEQCRPERDQLDGRASALPSTH